MTPTKTRVSQKILLLALGAVTALVLLEAGLRLAGWAMLYLQEKRNLGMEGREGVYRILCLGESTTMLGGADSYPRQLERILNERSQGLRFQVINKGVPGSDSTEILMRLEDRLERYRPQMVITMLGINDTEETPAFGETSFVKKKSFFKGLKIYKLAGLIKSHLILTWREIRDPFLKNQNNVLSGQDAFLERALKTEIKWNPRLAEPCVELSKLYLSSGKPKEAETVLRAGLRINPKKAWAYRHLGQLLVKLKRPGAAEVIFRQAVRVNQKKDWPYTLLSRFLENQKRNKEAEDVLAGSIRNNPRDPQAYLELASFYERAGQYGKAEPLLQEALGLDNKNPEVYLRLCFLLREQGRAEESDEMLEKAVVLDAAKAYMDLAQWHLTRGEYRLAEDVFRRAIAEKPEDSRFYRGYANALKRQGKEELAQQYINQAEELSLNEGFPAATKANYRRMAEIVLEKGIKLVCVQYAWRDIRPLKKMLTGFDGIIFVENKDIFEEALQGKRYEDYFTDSFAGDFGHCTPEGNYLLAENIAKDILKAVRSR